MANVYQRGIRAIVLYITIYLLWFFLRWLVLPHLKIFPYIPPQSVLVPAYNTVAYVATMIFHYILAFLIAIYIAWFIIKTYVPKRILFFKVRSRILAIEPFPSLTQAGILPFMDEIRKIIISLLPFKERLKRLWSATRTFFNTSIKHVLVNIRRDVVLSAPNLFKDGDGDVGDEDDADEDANAVPTADQALQDRETDELYQQCLEENTTPVPADASFADRLFISAQNSGVRASCGIRRLQAYSNMMNYQET